MNEFYYWFLNMIGYAWDRFYMSFEFKIGDLSVSLGSLLLGVAAVAMVVSVFWKGARS